MHQTVLCSFVISFIPADKHALLTLSLLMSYVYGAPLKPEILTSYIYIYGPKFGNAEIRLLLFAAQCFNTELMQKVILWLSCV
jgi:hypothetical protein